MDILRCIKKIYPDWNGVVWENSYSGIEPHDSETRPIPTMDDLEQAWIGIAREDKFSAIDVLRDAKIREGIPYTFPDSISGTIQTRDERDFRNIIGIATAGMIMSGQSITLPFRDKEDVSHSLTPEQAVALGVAVTNATAAIYQAAWAHKDALSALTTAEEIEAYDITVNWP